MSKIYCNSHLINILTLHINYDSCKNMFSKNLLHLSQKKKIKLNKNLSFLVESKVRKKDMNFYMN